LIHPKKIAYTNCIRNQGEVKYCLTTPSSATGAAGATAAWRAGRWRAGSSGRNSRTGSLQRMVSRFGL
jgi:hypothetical protein